MTSLDALARESGAFLMVAMDQRESLRTMLSSEREAPLAASHRERRSRWEARRVPVDDSGLARFKLAVARELGPLASGFLIDRHYAFDAIVRERLLPSSCGLVLAADALEQPPGGAVEDTDLDTHVDVAAAARAGVVALKLLVIWRDDDARTRRLETARDFVAVAREHGLLSVLEGVVRGPLGFEREKAIVTAARELASVGPSLYKCEVPLHGRGDPAEIERWSREIDAVVGCPWVVLSQGVEPDDFAAAVAAACSGGASGILAGRAIWAKPVADDDPTESLRRISVPRLHELARIVDEYARPWHAKKGER